MTLVKTYSLIAISVSLALVSAIVMPHNAAAQTQDARYVALTVKKNVVGGTAVPSDFLIHVFKNGSDIPGSPQHGSATGTIYAITPSSGTNFQVVEDEGGPTGYNVSFAGDCDNQGNVRVGSSVGVNCTLTNTFVGSSTPEDNNNADVESILPFLLANLGGGGVAPSCAVAPCALPPGQGQPTSSPSSVPGIPNTGAGGDVASTVFALLASLGLAIWASTRLRRR